ncbi:protein kinase [Streptomyces sp. NPDC048172]|uniref:serine/threonine-protein kinase n=1 Tax=Streptomyces sp. NPDC048172 TaxID=3365505 RepID=UPI00371580BC
MQPQEILDGRYRLLKELGQGGFGTVWRAFDTRMRRHVAIKVANSASGAADAERFLHEALLAGSLNHPHIVTVHEYGTVTVAPAAKPQIYVVMELVDGTSLDESLAGGTPSLNQALTWASEVSDALDAVHRQHIVHRDIKPGNVLIGPDGRAKVVDFGIAKNLAAHWKLTPTGAVMGTLPYLAPELFKGEAAEPGCDLYALGCMLTELCTGLPPFESVTPHSLMRQHTTEAPPSLTDRRPEIPAAVDELAQRLLAKEPGERPRDAAEVRDTLRRLALSADRAGEDAASPPPPSPPPVAPGPGPAGYETNAAPVPASVPMSVPASGDGERRRCRAAVVGVVSVSFVVALALCGWLFVPGPWARDGGGEGDRADDAVSPAPSASRPGRTPEPSAGGPARTRKPSDSGEAPSSPAQAGAGKPDRSSPRQTEKGEDGPDGGGGGGEKGKPSDGPGEPSGEKATPKITEVGKVDGYGACDYGRACVFEGYDGTGQMAYAKDCGRYDLAGLRVTVSSLRSHGNPITLYSADHREVGHIDSWTRSNLSPEENDRAVTAFIHC